MVHETIMSFTTRRLRPSALQRFAQQKVCRSSLLGLFESPNETTKTLKSNPYPAEIAVKCGHVPGFLKGFSGFRNHDLGQFWFFRAPLGFKGFATSAAAEMVSHRGIKSVEELRNEVESASSIDQIKDIFRNFESDMDGNDTRVGLACLTVGQELSSRGDVPESVLEYAKRALSILEKHDKNSVTFFTALHLIASTHYSMKQYSDSKVYLNRATKLIERLEKVESEVDTKLVASAIHTKAGDVSTALGKLAEGLSHYSKALELKKEVTKHNQPELAVSYRQLAECYVTLMNFKEALPLCLEALRIHMKHFGENSSVVAADRRTLAAIHSGIGDNNKALTEITAAKNIFKYWEMDSEVMDTELESCNVQMLLGKFEDANNTLGSLLEKTSEEDSKIRSTLLIYKGKALSNLKKFGEAKRMFKMATNILSTFEESDPIRVAEGYAEIALYYEMVDELEAAISLYKQAITLYGNCQENQHAAGSTEARLGWLLLLTGNLQESVTILEKAAGKLTESFGLGHYGLGYVYNNLGLAYKELERPQKSVELFTVARDILKKSFGSKHKDTMDALQNLAKVHSILGSHEVALKLYEEVAEVLQSYGDVFQDDLDEANRRIKDLKTEIQKSSDLFLKKRRPEKKRKIVNKKRGRTR